MGGPTIDLDEVLARQRRRDLLGRRPIEDQIRHARAFAGAWQAARSAQGEVAGLPRRVVDLGSGGGLPGLVLAVADWPDAEVALVDSSQRRCTFLEIEAQPLAPRVRVVWSRAEALGRNPAWRGTVDVVVARSMGAPTIVAECAAPLLHRGGMLVVSDPPADDGGDDDEHRWDDAGLAVVGLVRVPVPRVDGFGFTAAVQQELCPDRYPRRRLDHPPLF